MNQSINTISFNEKEMISFLNKQPDTMVRWEEYKYGEGDFIKPHNIPVIYKINGDEYERLYDIPDEPYRAYLRLKFYFYEILKTKLLAL